MSGSIKNKGHKCKQCITMLYSGEEFDANFYYYTGLDISNAIYLKDGKENEYLIIHKMDEQRCNGFKGSIITSKDPVREAVKICKRRCVKVDKSLPYGVYRIISATSRIIDSTDEIRKVRIKKKKKEVKCIRKAVAETKSILNKVIKYEELNKIFNKTEIGIAASLNANTYAKSDQVEIEPAFKPIVAGKNTSAIPHHEPTKRRINDMMLIDYGVKYKKYVSDITRCFFVKNNKEAKMYEKIKEIAYEIVDRIPEIETAKELCKIAKDIFKRKRIRHPPHLIGHGIGLEVHERPFLSEKSDDNLLGSTIAIEPAYYSKTYGVRYEIDVHVDKDKVRIL